jgi:hypothetical protein
LPVSGSSADESRILSRKSCRVQRAVAAAGGAALSDIATVLGMHAHQNGQSEHSDDGGDYDDAHEGVFGFHGAQHAEKRRREP